MKLAQKLSKPIDRNTNGKKNNDNKLKLLKKVENIELWKTEKHALNCLASM